MKQNCSSNEYINTSANKDFNYLEGFDLKHKAGKTPWITTMAGIITATTKCNSYLTIMDPKMDHFLVEMSEANKIGGQIHKLINQSNLGKRIQFN